ncbi:CD3072 family TudS-related putative desulfidase [Geosporobacter ferrireducens]|uniref:Uncharacterized protein n=1 Tax=Geosporobacter ferrireducens TaxID=1424294 RepID=A0A1D8GDH2_9FIRM|nr:CD3072 family TudS-related putative desulfidase [Geosporobacter ferrireducens]AOT68965.1 hypothetical protein Gferi_04990 [Geosporobacter ferrireducens]MTI54794.1 DUF523 domain-containing protein [Geosporobacter ferrireducens]
MFNDVRSKKIVFVCHCVLNQNSISDGTADFPGTNEEIVKRLMEAKVGVVQMPCPELMCLGLDRGDIKGAERPVVVENTRIRKELLKDEQLQTIDRLVENTVYQIEEYLKHGFQISGVVGINRSPSCGVNTTSENDEEVVGEGIFIKALRTSLKNRNIELNIVGIKSSKMDEAIESIDTLLNA